MKTTHTPGPWAFDQVRNGDTTNRQIVNHDAGNGAIALVYSGANVKNPRAMADAKHIVKCVNNCEGINPDAVRDMLAALENLVRFENEKPEIGTYAGVLWNQAQCAINKARGTE